MAILKNKLHVRRKHGVTLLYMALAFPVLAGFLSMGIDLGRVQLAKTQLYSATDAAARAAAAELNPGSNVSTDFSHATTSANAMLAANPVDSGTGANAVGTTITCGTWTSNAFTAGNTSSSNAVKVVTNYSVPTIWAAVLGRSACTVKSTSIGMITPASIAYGIVGISNMALNTSVTVDSYTSSSGSYAATKASNAAVACDASWVVNNSFTVKGNLDYGHGDSAPTGGTITGSRIERPASPTLSSLYPNQSVPGGAVNGGNFNGGNLTLNAGTYSYSTFMLQTSDTLTTIGKVSIYCSGNLNIQGNVNVGGVPSNCTFYSTGSGMNVSGSGSVYANFYGPTAPFNFNGSGDMYGSIVAGQVSVGGAGRIHCDNSGSSSSQSISIVR